MESLAMRSHTRNYSHVLEIDEEKRILTIYRVFDDGSKQLFTSVDFPGKSFFDDEPRFREFALKLGENLLLDSPAARRLLGL